MLCSFKKPRFITLHPLQSKYLNIRLPIAVMFNLSFNEPQMFMEQFKEYAGMYQFPCVCLLFQYKLKLKSRYLNGSFCSN